MPNNKEKWSLFFLYPPTIMFLKHIYKRRKETHTQRVITV